MGSAPMVNQDVRAADGSGSGVTTAAPQHAGSTVAGAAEQRHVDAHVACDHLVRYDLHAAPLNVMLPVNLVGNGGMLWL